MPDKPLNIHFVGDIAFVGSLAGVPHSGVFQGVQSVLDAADIVVGNLEAPLTVRGTPIPGKCTLRADPDWSRVMASAGIRVVSLANNHIMDYGYDGLRDTLQALESAGVVYAGAGPDLSRACDALTLSIGDRRVGMLCRNSVIVSAPVQATATRPGVAPLDTPELLASISACRSQVDVLIVSIHWGIEEYAYPSPEQRRLARLLISSGADFVIGHHPHVIQGLERIGTGVAAYSLGNFLFDDLTWEDTGTSGLAVRRQLTLSPASRRGIVLATAVRKSGEIATTPLFTRFIPEGTILTDSSAAVKKTWARLCRPLRWPQYDRIWRYYSMQREWSLRFKGRYGPVHMLRNIWRIRPRHIREFCATLRRSRRIVAQKTTNPYE